MTSAKHQAIVIKYPNHSEGLPHLVQNDYFCKVSSAYNQIFDEIVCTVLLM